MEISNKVALNLEDIKAFLPHRDPLLLIDTVHEIVPEKKIVASKLLTKNEPVFAGHFPNNPIYPGVYYIEAIAQAGAILTFATRTHRGESYERVGLLTSVQEARFRQPGIPEQRVVYEVHLEKTRGDFVWVKGTAFLNKEIAVECKLSLLVGSKKETKSDV